MDADTLLGTCQHRVMSINADNILDLLNYPLRIGSREIYLVENRKYFEISIKGKVHVGKSLGFDPLGRINHQQTPFTGGKRAGNLIGKVNMAGGIDQIENIGSAIISRVVETHSLRLDGNAPFTLKIHLVEELILLVPVRKSAGILQKPVCKSGFTVIYMGDN